MKKLFFVLVAILLLAGCGKVKIHENVNEQVAEDSMQVMDRILYNIDKDIPIDSISEQDEKLFERFTNKYIDKTDVIPVDLDGVDRSINIMATASLVKYAKGVSLESDKDEIKENYDYMIQFIEEGESAASDEPSYRILEFEEEQ